jgi:protocatechuate 3,4-dioxygenase beta subunit
LADLTAKTDENGTARFTVTDVNLVTDRYVWFGVADEAFAGRGDVGISPIDREFTFTFKTLPLHQRTVKIVDPQGKGVAGAKVWLSCPDIFPDNSDRRSDSEGRIVLKCPPGKLTVAAVAPDHASATLHGVECNESPPLVIQLREGRRIEGQILDAQGRPVGGLLVRARKNEFFHSHEEFILQTRTDKDGRFAIRNASPGDWEISARSEDPNRPFFVAPVTCGVSADRDTQDIALETREGFRIQGRYVSRYRTELSRPDTRHSISFGVASPIQAHWEEQIRDDGTFDVWGLPCHAEGDVDFTGMGGFHVALRMRRAPPFFRIRNTRILFENVPPGTYDGIEVHFLLAGRVEGTVTDGAGNPIQDVEVVVSPPGYIYRCNEKGEFAGTLAPDEPTILTVRTRREERGSAGEILLVSEPFTAQEGQIVEKHLVQGPVAQNEPSSPAQQPSLATLNIDVKSESLAGKRVLVCFFDMTQRPSRRIVQELAARAKPLVENGLAVLLIQVGEPDKAAWQEWLDHIGVPFPVATTTATMSTLSRDWTVRALPWLVLLDESHAVQATGFDLAQLEEGLKSGGFAPPSRALDWHARFDKVYHLEGGRVLKHIVPPFIPERNQYDAESRRPGERLPDQLIFHWDKSLSLWGFSGGAGNLDQTLWLVLELKRHEYESPQRGLNLPLPGDWIVRAEAPVEAKLKALEQILAEETGRKIRFVNRPVEREVVVAGGRFELHELPKPFESGRITMYAGEPDHNVKAGAGTVHSLDEFLETLEETLEVPLLNETDSTEALTIAYNIYPSACIAKIQDPAEKARRLQILMENLSTQTSLRFTVERRSMSKWFVFEEGS